MLISLSASNFRSFKSVVDFNMIASTREKSLENEIVHINRGLDVTKSAVIFGPNASGKTNLIEILKFMKYCVLEKLPDNTSDFSFKENSDDENSDFFVRISVNEELYEYGFTLNFSRREIVHEWAFKLSLNGKKNVIFRRTVNEGKFDISGNFFTTQDMQRLKVYFEDFRGNNTKLMLTFLNEDKKSSSEIDVFKDIYNWFYSSLVIIFPETKFANLNKYIATDSMDKITDLIKQFDTGIIKIIPCEVSINEFKEIMGEDADQLISELVERSDRNPDKTVGLNLRTLDSYFNLKYNPKAKNRLEIRTIKISHLGIEKDFKFSEESDGTRRIFDFIELLVTNKENVYVIDELDRSLHPVLVAHFIKMFRELSSSYKSQLIFTTHQPSLMDENLFRKDEIWFVDKDFKGNSNVYPLDIFKERNDRKFSKAYFEGRYGALPVLTRNFNYNDCESAKEDSE